MVSSNNFSNPVIVQHRVRISLVPRRPRCICAVAGRIRSSHKLGIIPWQMGRWTAWYSIGIDGYSSSLLWESVAGLSLLGSAGGTCTTTFCPQSLCNSLTPTGGEGEGEEVGLAPGAGGLFCAEGSSFWPECSILFMSSTFSMLFSLFNWIDSPFSFLKIIIYQVWITIYS